MITYQKLTKCNMLILFSIGLGSLWGHFGITWDKFGINLVSVSKEFGIHAGLQEPSAR